jgi:tRNA-2-methylthio-N6-dimethylallyladenosine synthase
VSKRESLLVPQEEITRQREFIHQIRELKPGSLKKYNISTFGCQMNENDSERLAGMLSEMGYTSTDSTDESDLIIYNTCCVRENAEFKVYGHLGSLKKLKQQKPEMIIAVCGCMMQQKEVVEFIKKKHRHVDLIFGTHNLYKFPELLYSVFNSDKSIIDIWDSSGSIAEGMPIERKDGIKAWVTIMYGCNNFCSYCIVPYVRGRERSRDPEDIIDEAGMLGHQGYKEITLLGQNVNSYGKDIEAGTSFPGLLRRLNELDGLERIRFMTSHPKDLSDELIEAVRDCRKVCEHIHLPIQSGSSRILNEMNRKYTSEYYLELVSKIRSQVPGISLTTDIIVGFPGESEEDFEQTLQIMEKARFDFAYTFLYSKRTGTPASKIPEQVDEVIKKQRFERLLNLQNRISREINQELLGSTVEVLVEGLSRNSMKTYTGRTKTNKIVNFEGNRELTGRLVNVSIEKIQTWSLEGKIIYI